MKYKLIFLIIYSFVFSKSEPYVLVVSLDGFRYDYMNFIDTPNLNYLKENGVKSKSLKPIFPSLTFPNHYSIATGCYSNEHKISGNKFYSKEFQKYYSYKDAATVQDGRFYGCEPIWVKAERNGIKSATYFWVGSEAEIQNYRPSIYKKYNPNISFKSRIDSAMSWIDLPYKLSPRLIMLYFNEPDRSGHVNGPRSSITIDQVARMDSLMGYLIKEINKRDKNINLIVLSDHGMAEIKNTHVMIDDYINIDNYNIFGSGAFIQLDLKNNKNSIIKTELDNIPNIKYYFKNQIPERYQFVNVNTKDILLVADQGYLIGIRENINNGLFNLKGMHGYDPEYINMHGIFYAYGPEFKKQKIVSTFENTMIHKLICNILKIEIYNDEIIKNIIK